MVQIITLKTENCSRYVFLQKMLLNNTILSSVVNGYPQRKWVPLFFQKKHEKTLQFLTTDHVMSHIGHTTRHLFLNVTVRLQCPLNGT
jgi:hypothetical protein